jgi:hypothetical protein
MTEETTRSRVFICYWDCNGFEVIKDMTSWERQSLLDTLAGKELSKPPISLKMLTLRAQFNPQRHPEIWTFNTEGSVDEEALWQYAIENPQSLVDLIRANGKKIYGISEYKDPIIR